MLGSSKKRWRPECSAAWRPVKPWASRSDRKCQKFIYMYSYIQSIKFKTQWIGSPDTDNQKINVKVLHRMKTKDIKR